MPRLALGYITLGVTEIMRRVFVDTEWTAVPWSRAAELLWIGLADENGLSCCGLVSDAQIDPANEGYVSDLLQLVTPEVQRLTRIELAAAVEAFCGHVDEFWAWIPTPESFAAWSRLGESAFDTYRRCRHIDLQMLQSLVKPWPTNWPIGIHDLNVAAVAAGVQLPPRAVNHLHPRVHAEWNQQLFGLIRAAGPTSDA